MVALARDNRLDALRSAYGVTSVFADSLQEEDFHHPTRCAEWNVGELLFHLLLDAQRALVAFATPAEDAPDLDFVSYWLPYKPGTDDAAKHARFVRAAASAYSSPRVVAAHRRELADAAVRSAGSSTAERIRTQGHVLTVPDFLATLVVEATVHHLDLIGEFGEAPRPDSASLALVQRTLGGLLGTSHDLDWDEETYALKGTGRLPLSDEERSSLGGLADRFPLLG